MVYYKHGQTGQRGSEELAASRCSNHCVMLYIYIYVYIHTYVYIYIYISYIHTVADALKLCLSYYRCACVILLV